MTPDGCRIGAVICAAGASARFGGRKKEYLPLPGRGGLTVLGAAAQAFLPEVDLVAITVPPGGQAEAGAALPAGFCPGDSPLFVEGGASRQASVHAALRSLAPFRLSHVLIHDGARPFVSSSLIRRVIAAALRHGAAVPIVPLTDTVKEIDGDGFIKRHLRRAALGNAQTPQGFRFGEILQAHDKAEALGLECTDDAEVWGEFAGRVAWVPGEEANRKITFPEDLR